MDETILKELRNGLLERIDLSHLPDEVWKRSSALNTWGTNAIEGSTITWKDAQKILMEGRSVKDRPIGDVMETIQHERAFRGMALRKNRPLDLVTILELHEEVFKGVLVDAGNWRRINVRIQGADFTPPRMEKVVERMECLLRDHNKRDIEGEDVFTLGARMHHEFESIHPFSDGNGRVGRLLLNLHFLKHNWPPVHVLPNDREEYLGSLDRANKGDLSLLISFIKRSMGSSLLDLLDQVGTSEDELVSLKEASTISSHDAKYLGLRCKQGELPGVLREHKWSTSRRALELYRVNISR